MHKFFNVSGDCKPGLHYMVDLSSRPQKIKSMVDSGQYFTINRARQYGKTTTWSKAGLLEAVKIFLSEKNTLFESLIGKLNDYPELKHMLSLLLFQGQTIMYNADDPIMDIGIMFGVIKRMGHTVDISNKIFETRLHNYLLMMSNWQVHPRI